MFSIKSKSTDPHSDRAPAQSLWLAGCTSQAGAFRALFSLPGSWQQGWVWNPLAEVLKSKLLTALKQSNLSRDISLRRSSCKPAKKSCWLLSPGEGPIWLLCFWVPNFRYFLLISLLKLKQPTQFMYTEYFWYTQAVGTHDTKHCRKFLTPHLPSLPLAL